MLRFYTAFVGLLAIFYIGIGLLGSFRTDSIAKALTQAGAFSDPSFPYPELAQWSLDWRRTTAMVSVLGAVMFVFAFGLWSRIELARKLWLAFVMILPLFHLYWVWVANFRVAVSVGGWLETAAVLGFTIYSWVLLGSENTRKTFAQP